MLPIKPRPQPLYYIAIFSTLAALCIFGYLRSSVSTPEISKISPSDQDILRRFFHQVLYKEGLIYVLCGSKPVGTACYTSSLIPEMDAVPLNQTLKAGWKAFLNNKDLFPSGKILFRTTGDEEKDCTIKMLLINKYNLKMTLIQYRPIFEEILGNKIDINDILTRFEHDEDPIQSIFKNNHLLIGILHGFGPHNSRYFQDQFIQSEKVRSQFSSQIEMCEKTNSPSSKTLEDSNHPILNLPVFMVDPEAPETAALRAQYQEERTQILNKCSGTDLLEVVLNAWKYPETP